MAQQLRKLNDLLCTSFDNVKYDVRALNNLAHSLQDQIGTLSTQSILNSLEEQNNIILEQQKAINQLMVRLDNIQPTKTINRVNTVSLEEPQIPKGEVKITKVQFKAQGNGKKNLNGEWVEITGFDVDMSDYKLHDQNKKHTFNFPKGFTIYGPVKIFSGKGKNTNTKLYWDNSTPIWNDSEDIATLTDNKGKILSRVQSKLAPTFTVLQ
jgi:hypothetical protein